MSPSKMLLVHRMASSRVACYLLCLIYVALLIIFIKQPSSITWLEMEAHPMDNPLLPAVDPRSYWRRNKEGEHNTSIIIYTKQRCGSTFMSEPFNKHPDIFYIFEPLNHVHWDHLYVQGQADVLLKDVFGCNSQHVKALVCDEHRDWWVNKHLYCHMEDQNPSACHKQVANFTKMDILCKQHSYKATKLITLPSVHLLQPYVNEGAKVIVGVRDPRGVIISRNGIEPHLFKAPRDYYNIAMVYCTEMLTDLLYVRSKWLETPQVTSEAFYLVRYEDLAMDPVKETQEIFKFLNIPFHERVLNWAKGVAAGRKHANQSPFSTVRTNSTRTSEGWKYKRDVPLSLIHLIEDACRPLMKLLGYKFVHEINSGSESSDFKVNENVNYLGNFDRDVFFGQ